MYKDLPQSYYQEIHEEYLLHDHTFSCDVIAMYRL